MKITESLSAGLLLSCLFAFASAIEINVFSISDCEPKVESEIEFTQTLKTDPKALDATLVLPFSIEGDDMFVLEVDKYDDIEEKWDKNFNHLEGDLCSYKDKHLSDAWAKLQKASDNENIEDCRIEEGTYVIKDLELLPTDVVIPSTFIGRFMLNTNIVKEEKIFCMRVDLEIKD